MQESHLDTQARDGIFVSSYIKLHWLISPLDKMAAILADDIFNCIFLNEKFCISIEISMKFVPKGPIDNNQALV